MDEESDCIIQHPLSWDVRGRTMGIQRYIWRREHQFMKSVRFAKLTVLSMAVLGLLLISVPALAANAKEPPIKLGVISAWDFAGGQGIKRGAELAIRDINKAGGLLGRKVEGVFYDNKCDADEAKKATERLLYMDKVDAVTGCWRSDLAIVIQPTIMEAKKIFFIGGSSSPILTTERIGKDYNTYKYTFAIEVNTNALFISHETGIRKGLKLGLDKIAVLVEKAAWCDPLYDDVMAKFKDDIVYSTRFSPTVTDFSIEYTKAKAAGANNLYVVATGASGTPSVKQWYDMQLPMLYTSYNVEAQDGNFWKITEGKCEGVVTEIVGGTAGFPITSKSRPWYEDYVKTYGEKPVAYTNGFEYDAVMAWAKAVKMAGSVESDAVLKALESKDFNYTGVCGEITAFDEIHNPVGKAWKKGEAWGYISVQWQDGKLVPIWPEGLGSLKYGEMIIPERVKQLMQ